MLKKYRFTNRTFSSVKKLKIIATALLVLPLFLLNTASAQKNRVDLYSLCSKFPLNSRCKGYEIPVALKERPGENAECLFKGGNNNQSGNCKVVLTSENLTVYLEHEKRLEILNNQRATRTVTIPTKSLVTFNYLEYHQDNSAATVAFGLLGALFFDEDKLSELEISFTDELDSTPATINYLTLTTKKETGVDLRKQLEDLTLNPEVISPPDLATNAEAEVSLLANSEQMKQLRRTNECKKCDLRKVNLAGANLKNANLQQANLEEANLEEANLEEANLEGANLRYANLAGAVLRNANLSTKGKTRTNLNHANLSGADLSNAKLNGATLGRANLETTNLQNSNLGVADLGTFGGSSYHYFTNFSYANLKRANLTNANLTRAILVKAQLNEAILKNTALKFANLESADLSDSDLSSADLKRAFLVNAELSSANLTDTQLEDIDMRGANFRNANLTDASLKGSNLCHGTMPDGSISTQGCE